jgi:uncharacterized protein
MINIAELLEKTTIRGNYYAADNFVTGDFEAGLLENRSGSRLIALPDTLLQALYSAIEEETGPAAGQVLFNCGSWWGRNFYRRFLDELSAYYGRPVGEMEMVEFIESLKQCWKAHGWGTMVVDMDYTANGYIVLKTWRSPFAAVAPKQNRPMCFFEMGLLQSFFCQLTGRKLRCVQISCESMEADCNRFVIGLPERLVAADLALEEQQDHVSIMERLCQA